MATYERVGHEILVVEEVPRKRGSGPPHIVKRGHTLYCHAAISASQPVAGAVTLSIRLHPWSDPALTCGPEEDREFVLLIDGEPVGTITTVNGQAQQELQFTDPGVYVVEVRHETAQGAQVEVTV